MTCREFQEILPEIIDGGQSIEQEMHWKSCRECSDLVADLTLISQQAADLRERTHPARGCGIPSKLRCGRKVWSTQVAELRSYLLQAGDGPCVGWSL